MRYKTLIILSDCGSSLAVGAGPAANPNDCSAPCTGNVTEACGGGSRLTLFYSPKAVGPQPNPGPAGWSYVGCYTYVLEMEGFSLRPTSF